MICKPLLLVYNFICRGYFYYEKVVKLQKEITNDLGDKEKLDLLIAIDNVRLIQYTCPSNEFFSIS